jgi:crossover junction endodeoxyribonuclease RusA
VGERFDIEIPLLAGKPPLSQNDRLHWTLKHERTSMVRNAAAWAAKGQKIPAAARITAQLHYATGDNRRRDAPNLTATSKPAIDGLVDAGVVPDDSDRYVTEVMPVIHNGPGDRRLWLTVEINVSAEDHEAIVADSNAERAADAATYHVEDAR